MPKASKVIRGARDVFKVNAEQETPFSISRDKVAQDTIDTLDRMEKENRLGPAVTVHYLPHSGAGQSTIEAAQFLPFRVSDIYLMDTPVFEYEAENVDNITFFRTSWIGDISPRLPRGTKVVELDSGLFGDHGLFFRSPAVVDYTINEIIDNSYEVWLDDIKYVSYGLTERK
ncbi:MAG: hypothetical protein WBD17_01645 [Candidatus Omnitrophota bacterium]